MSGETKAKRHGVDLTGLRWKAVINGRKSINGARYSATMDGAIEGCEPGDSVYDVMELLAGHLEENNRDMEFPDSFRVTLYPRES